MELWDGYLKDGTLAGVDIVRGEEIPQGLYHIVSAVIVRHTDGEYLIMQRDYNKIGFPGLHEPGASGSVVKGETPLEGALRELSEECGIIASELTFLFARSNMKHVFYYYYLYITDCEKDSITLQEGETIAYKWLNRKEFLSFIHTDEFVPYHRHRILPYIDLI